MKHRSRSSRRDGFTLIEVMVAIAIAGMVFLGAFSAIRSGVNTQMFVREMSDAGREGPSILAQLTNDLNNAAFYNFDKNVFFVCKPVERSGGMRADQLHFVTHRSSMAADPDLSGRSEHDLFSPLTEVSWMLRSGEGEFLMLARRESPYIDDNPFAGGYLRLISAQVLSFKVQSTGWDLGLEPREGVDAAAAAEAAEAAEEEGTLIWEDEWDSESRGCLPSAIRIELLIAPDVDPDVMRHMAVDRRLEALEKSYIHIILLPQFREDVGTVRETATWTGEIREPTTAGQPGGAGGRGGAGRGNRQLGDGGPGAGAPARGGPPQGSPAGNSFLDALRGQNNNRGNVNIQNLFQPAPGGNQDR